MRATSRHSALATIKLLMDFIAVILCGLALTTNTTTGQQVLLGTHSDIDRKDLHGSRRSDFAARARGDGPPSLQIDRFGQETHGPIDESDVNAAGMKAARGDDGVRRVARGTVLSFLPRVEIGIDGLAARYEWDEAVGS